MSLDPDRARELEERDPLPTLRDEFLIPKGWAYLAGNSLGLQPRAAQAAIQDELDEWARLGVEGWFEAREPWLEYAGALRGSVARARRRRTGRGRGDEHAHRQPAPAARLVLPPDRRSASGS